MVARSRLLRLAICLFTIAARRVGAQAQAPVPRAAREIPRGTVLSVADVEGDSAVLAGASTLAGWVTRRVVRQGEPLREPAVAPPQLLQTGTSVVIRATFSGVTVAREGIALSGGSLGQHIRIRLDAQRIITGTVSGPATVRVP
ncbi:MAG: flagellar basal body P-ring formation chaperone FlgA [Gemmatimonadales bacterium]